MVQEMEYETEETEDSIEISVIKSDNMKDIHSQEAIKPDEEELEYGLNASDIANDRMAANLADNYIQKDPDEGSSDEKIEKEDEHEEEDDYEILTYRKKEYWINKNEEKEINQYVYEVLKEDGLGDRIGSFKKGPNGKMKVFLDRK